MLACIFVSAFCHIFGFSLDQKRHPRPSLLCRSLIAAYATDITTTISQFLLKISPSWVFGLTDIVILILYNGFYCIAIIIRIMYAWIIFLDFFWLYMPFLKKKSEFVFMIFIIKYCTVIENYPDLLYSLLNNCTVNALVTTSYVRK